MNSLSSAHHLSEGHEVATETEGQQTRSVMEMLRQFATVSTLLRLTGAASVIASMSVFLLQGWDTGNDINRYYLLLSQTILLAMGGFGLAFLMKENKGARVFFGLSLVSVTANLTTLGALIFSFTQWGGSLSDYPDFALWSVSSGSAIGVALGVAAVVLIPVTLFGFKIMARRSALSLTGAYLVSSSLLLLPVRDTFYTSILAGLSILLSSMFISKLLKKDSSLRTMEGAFARSLLFISPVIMIARSVWLYQTDMMMYTVMGLTAFMTLRHTSLLMNGESRIRRILELVSVSIAFVIAATASQLIDELFTVELLLPAFAIVFVVPMCDLIRRTEIYKSDMIVLTGLVAVMAFITHLAFYEGLINGIMAATAGLVVMAIGYLYQRTILTLAGLLAASVAIAYDVTQVASLVDLLNWTGLAVVGVSAIVIGSVIERHGVAIKLRIENYVRSAQKRVA